MTHKTLVNRAKRWLYAKHWSIVITELSTSAGETPDAIGFRSSGGRSILIECKVSREDFLKDRNKIFRQFEEYGMGNERYFLAPKGLIEIIDLPDGWGLLEVDDRDFIKIKKDASHKEANKLNEVKFLVSVIRRLEISTCVYVVAESIEAKEDATTEKK